MDPVPASNPRRAAALSTWLACGLAAALAWAAPAWADDDLPGRVGRVADVAGELFLSPQDAPDQWQAVGINYPVTTGDNLWAGNDARAEVDFGAGQFRLAGDTNLHLSRLDDRQFALFVAQGRVSVRVRFLDPGEVARIDTPNAQVVLTRPGFYRVDVSGDRGQTRLVVREGEANVLTAGALQQVLPGQTAVVDGADPQYASVSNGIGTDGFDAWAAARDRRYERGRSASYVSPQMVGAAELDAYGSWSEVPQYGAVWYPNDVPSGWAPYQNGYWTEVGAWGPTWVDYSPWGYAPFHYGRWVFVGSRWGWCPGAFVARPLWAPAMVAWAGGPGWGLSLSVGAPVWGWTPLAWGEPYRPWWGRCSTGCWDRYNRPYNVNVNVVRPNSPPPTRYVNWNAPGGMSAMAGNTLIVRKPVRENLVAVPGGVAANAPVMASAPRFSAEPGRVPTRRVGEGAPPPASTFYPATARSRGMGVAPGTAPVNTVVPAARTRTDAPGSAVGSPMTRTTPVSPGAGSGYATPGATSPLTRETRPVAPAAQGAGGAPGAAMGVARPATAGSPQGLPAASQPAATPPARATTGGMAGAAPTASTPRKESPSDSRTSYMRPAPTAPRAAPAQPSAGLGRQPVPAQPSAGPGRQPVPAPSSVGVGRPSVQAQPQPIPMKVPNAPQQQAPMARTQPAPMQAPQAAPAAPTVRTPPPAPTSEAQSKPASDGSMKRQRGEGANPDRR
ncbi:MAG: FecR domain-containing protein [Burkholderiales bacterium]|nr:FecR domain-containing protein [Burkholderiales bacterium]